MITTDCFVAVADVAMMTNPYRLVIDAPMPSQRFVVGLANTFGALNGPARLHRPWGQCPSSHPPRLGPGAMKPTNMDDDT
jgi:hypothetical protein